jgi:hypothetical protein
MKSWLESLLDPHELEIAAQRGSDDPRGGLALLLDGQLFIYERLATQYSWPRLGDRPRKSWPRENRLLAAVALHVTSSREASAAYEALLKPSPADSSFRAVLMVLYSILLADEGRDDRAAEVLEQALNHGDLDPLERMLLLLHLSVREAERDRLGAAATAAERVAAEPPHRRDRHQRALKRIAEHNLAAYRQLAGEHVNLFRLPLRGTELPLLRGAIDISVGLEKYLDDQFQLATRDPWARTVTWRPEDPIEMRLRGAVVRADSLADWNEQRHTRSVLGRYHVVSRLGTREGVAPQAFTLLRTAGDDKAITATTRSVAAIGPLGALRDETLRALRSPWPRAELNAALSLIAGGADLLQPAEADRALKRLMASVDLPIGHVVPAFRAIAQLAPAASDKQQTAVSRYARATAGQSSDSLVLQELQRVVWAVRWPAVSPAERRRWVDFILEHQVATGDSRLFANTAAAALAPAEPETIGKIFVNGLEHEPDLERLAMAIDANIALPRGLRRRALEETSAALAEIRRQAASGSYAFGGVDVALLTLKLLSEQTRDPRWDELGEFVVDPRVGIDAKVRTIEALADRRGTIPARFQELLRKNVATITGFVDTLGASENALKGATLRLWLRLSGLRRDELLSRLVDLAGSLDREARHQAALTLPAAQRRLGDDATLTLGLTLTRDADVMVRAVASQSLARLRGDRAGELNAILTKRLVALLEEPGTDVPYRTIAGLVQAARDGQPVGTVVLDAVRRAQISHPSRRVGGAAKILLAEAG